ncbi:unnamed protein product [Ectocarpus sp. 12 AP-2014]
MAAPSSDGDLWVYHEKQMSSLCGQHCINNLVQAASYSAADLAEIAHELDEQERKHMLAAGSDTPDALKFLAEESGNVDAAGNFSIQVLNTALKRLYGAYLVSAGSESVGKLSTTGYDVEDAFVLNRHAHWVAVRSIGGAYWDLNSMLDNPTRITTFALEAYLHQLREDGYSVFVVRGDDLPPPATEPREGSRDCWYRVKDLLEVSRGGKGSGGALNTAATDVWLNSGPGQRLDGGTTSKSSGKDGRDSGGAGTISAEDMQLAMAISASMGGSGGAEEGGEGEDEMARAIALSLSEDASASSSSAGLYTPQPVPELQPNGPDVVRVQLRVGGSQRVVHSFRRSDSVTALFDVAAQALAKADGKALSSPFDVVAPGGRALLKAGVVVPGTHGGDAATAAKPAGSGGEESDGGGPTIGSEQLGGASVIVRRA